MHAHHLFPSQPLSQKPNGEKEVKMVKQAKPNKSKLYAKIFRGAIPLLYLFLLIEFFDDLNYGIGNMALPAIRTDLGLSSI